MQSEMDYVSLSEIYVNHCSSLNQDIYAPLDYCRQQLNVRNDLHSSFPNLVQRSNVAKFDVYQSIAKNVPDTILSKVKCLLTGVAYI